MPAPLEIVDVLLEREERLPFARALAQPDAAGPKVADDAAPERVVQVEDEDLLAPAGDRPQQAEDALRVGDQAFRAARHLEFEVEARVEPAPGAGLGGQALQVMEHDIRRGALGEEPVEPLEVVLAGRRDGAAGSAPSRCPGRPRSCSG